MRGLLLVGIVFTVAVAAAVFLVLKGNAVPERISTLTTAIAAGVLGGLFGYSRNA